MQCLSCRLLLSTAPSGPTRVVPGWQGKAAQGHQQPGTRRSRPQCDAPGGCRNGQRQRVLARVWGAEELVPHWWGCSHGEDRAEGPWKIKNRMNTRPGPSPSGCPSKGDEHRVRREHRTPPLPRRVSQRAGPGDSGCLSREGGAKRCD